jgi:hypothetical protein
VTHRRGAALLVAALAVGCSHASPRSSGPTTTGPPVATTGATTTVATNATTSSTSPAATSTTSTTHTTGSSRCGAGSLSVTLTELGAAAGTAYRELEFKNTSAQTCTMQGYPGVSFVDTNGRQIGAPAQRMTGPGGPIALGAGASAAALMAYHDVYVATVPGCQPTTAAGIRVYPPDETRSLTVSTALMVCANPATAGSAGVSPVTTLANVHP